MGEEEIGRVGGPRGLLRWEATNGRVAPHNLLLAHQPRKLPSYVIPLRGPQQHLLQHLHQRLSSSLLAKLTFLFSFCFPSVRVSCCVSCVSCCFVFVLGLMTSWKKKKPHAHKRSARRGREEGEGPIYAT